MATIRTDITCVMRTMTWLTRLPAWFTSLRSGRRWGRSTSALMKTRMPAGAGSRSEKRDASFPCAKRRRAGFGARRAPCRYLSRQPRLCGGGRRARRHEKPRLRLSGNIEIGLRSIL
jgi:hypothetical protein